QLVPHVEGRQVDQAEICQGGFLLDGAVVARHRTPYGDDDVAPGTARVEPPPAGLGTVGVDHAVVVNQLLRMFRHTAPLQVGGRCADDAARGRDLSGDEPGVLQLGHPQRQIETFLDDVDAPVLEAEFEANLRV